MYIYFLISKINSWIIHTMRLCWGEFFFFLYFLYSGGGDSLQFTAKTIQKNQRHKICHVANEDFIHGSTTNILQSLNSVAHLDIKDYCHHQEKTPPIMGSLYSPARQQKQIPYFLYQSSHNSTSSNFSSHPIQPWLDSYPWLHVCLKFVKHSVIFKPKPKCNELKNLQSVRI